MAYDAKHWFPDFCRTPVVFSLMVVAQLVVLVMWLAPGRALANPLRELAISSLFAQWLVLLCAVSLCKLRPWLNTRPVLPGLGLAYGWILLLVGCASYAAVAAERFAGFGLTQTGPEVSRYVWHNVGIAALVAAAALRYYYIQQQWLTDIQARSEAQIRALQARIRPHFLFNSMNTIASLIRSRPQVAEQTVLDLCELFRAALSGSGEDSTLGQELTLCRRYMDIEQLRLGDRLQVDWQIAAVPKSEPLPPLILQPLFENAVYHGIQPLPEGGTIRVTGGTVGDHWFVSIENPRSELPISPSEGNQIALANIRQRLAHRYHGEGKLSIDESPQHFSVTVTAPSASESAKL